MRCYGHRFDPGTHRCVRCDRWQAGFAPKKAAPEHGTGECQICEHTQALNARGGLVLHGYKRPGFGWLVGECHGTKHLPFPATDALEAYRKIVARYLDTQRAWLVQLPRETEFVVEQVERDYSRRGSPVKATYKFTVKRGDESKVNPRGLSYPRIPSFDDELAARLRLTQRDIDNAARELKRVDARIAKGKELQAKGA